MTALLTAKSGNPDLFIKKCVNEVSCKTNLEEITD